MSSVFRCPAAPGTVSDHLRFVCSCWCLWAVPVWCFGVSVRFLWSVPCRPCSGLCSSSVCVFLWGSVGCSCLACWVHFGFLFSGALSSLHRSLFIVGVCITVGVCGLFLFGVSGSCLGSFFRCHVAPGSVSAHLRFVCSCVCVCVCGLFLFDAMGSFRVPLFGALVPLARRCSSSMCVCVFL